MIGGWGKYTVGRIYAIPVRVDATFLIVPLFLYHSSLSASWEAVATGLGAIFFSILFHELGHALTAKSLKIGVQEIVVGGFYGYATLKPRSISRSEMIRILAAGPSANLAIFIILATAFWLFFPSERGLGGLLVQTADASWIRETVRVVALINVTMFVFNAAPAFPLDGGRILDLVLGRFLSAQLNKWIVSGLGIAAGFVMVLLGLGVSIVLAIVGALIIMANLSRLRRRPATKIGPSSRTP